ncbi:peptidoglycan DD-metalloendopeptidase family protein [Ramlibacter sp.]|uniref:M23 family metallopeptidase n=1 Tax=Ramlibacter sp. TaxID=1917967 RepID=UPI00345DEEEF
MTALIAALLLGGGGGAFAVASLGPDASALPVRQVVEFVEPLPLQAQSEALDAHTFSVFTSAGVRQTDTIEALLSRLGINDPEAAGFLRQNTEVRALLVAGRTVSAEATDGRNLISLRARWVADDSGNFKRLVVERQNGLFTARIENVPLVPSLRVASGVVRSSLFATADEAGIPDQVTLQLAEIFGGDIDFHRGLRKGDRISVVYEALEADGEPLRPGRVVSAEFVNNGRNLEAMWFQEPGKRGGYFNFRGESLERAFLASPMEFSRVTSGFSMRLHPIHNTWRAHKGTDYGAPTGTPVRTVADGKVEFAGVMGGYGNVVQIAHGKGDTTLYAHLSRIDVRQGGSVERGQRIGAVGSTGWSTGPHLHFEFRENGVHRDPLEVARARAGQGVVLAAAARPDFERASRALRSQLAAAAAVVTQVAVATAR